MKNTILALCCILLFVACHQENRSKWSMKDMNAHTSSAMATSVTVQNEAAIPNVKTPKGPNKIVPKRKVIKTAHIKFQVDSLEKRTDEIATLCQENGGYLSTLNQHNSQKTIRNHMQMKVPAERFDFVLSELGEKSLFLDYKRVEAKDVSEEFVDISARLAAKKAVQAKYSELLRSKAGTVQEIFTAEEKIRGIQEEIESIEGRLNFLNHQSSLSTIQIEIYQTVHFVKSPEVYQKTYVDKFDESFARGWGFVQGLSLLLISIWPALLLASLFFAFRRQLKTMLYRSIRSEQSTVE